MKLQVEHNLSNDSGKKSSKSYKLHLPEAGPWDPQMKAKKSKNKVKKGNGTENKMETGKRLAIFHTIFREKFSPLTAAWQQFFILMRTQISA